MHIHLKQIYKKQLKLNINQMIKNWIGSQESRQRRKPVNQVKIQIVLKNALFVDVDAHFHIKEAFAII